MVTWFLAAPGSAVGFGTIDAGGQNREHERITRAALSCGTWALAAECFAPRTLDYLAGHGREFGAVGAPDSDELSDPAAHCDDADFLAGPYPRSREEATAALTACVESMRGRFATAVEAAGRLVDDRGHLVEGEVDPATECRAVERKEERAKCTVLEMFGRVLHGAQDFYAHSNWADEADPARPIGDGNPPGLGLPAPSPVLDLRSGTAPSIPAELSTGCFVVRDEVPGVGACTGRVTHAALNKDRGIVDPVTGEVADPTTSRGMVGHNFAAAVAAAEAETARQWRDLRAELVVRYGAERGGLMRCALVRDDPVEECRGGGSTAFVGIVVGSGLAAVAAVALLLRRPRTRRRGTVSGAERDGGEHGGAEPAGDGLHRARPGDSDVLSSLAGDAETVPTGKPAHAPPVASGEADMTAQDASPEVSDALDAGERAELERLRQENSALRAGPPRRRARIRWRSVVAAVLIVLGVVLTPVSLVSVWTRQQLSNTDSFVATVGPVIDDPAVQAAVTDRVTTTVFSYVDVQQLADEALAALAAQGLPPRLVERLGSFTPALQTAATGFVHDKVGLLVASPQFAEAWDRALRLAHQQLVAVLSGDSQAVVVQNGTVYLDLAPVIDAAKQRLVAEGLTAAGAIPEVHPTIALAPADKLVRAQWAYTTFTSVATVLPWITLLLLAVGVYLARRRLRALIGAALGVALALVVLAAGLLVVRGVLVGAVPQTGAVAAASAFDLLVGSLRTSGRALLVLALVVALGAFLAGPSATATGLRRRTAGLVARIRGGRSTGPVGAWVGAHVRVLRIGAVAVAALVFVFLSQPTGVTILVIVAVLLVVLAVIEFLARPAAGRDPSETAP
ncbi:hypothetical protein GCM10023175_30920 [Pseudonocardia xishanensis]|uniref:Uncharacterized protein n=2 Tax=Pseudonocardia xishanensis TaxID=630995 RepID=A0ABP8RTZ8_9PSEU